MPARDPDLQTFFDALFAAYEAQAPKETPMAAAVARAKAIMARPGTPMHVDPVHDPVHDWLEEAQANAAASPARDLEAAFRPIAARLSWQARADRKSPEPNFAARHGNAQIVGDGGIEVRSDIRIGASLLAPETHYPDHRHPPEEVYVALSQGSWRQNDGPWHEPGPGGLVYNPPNIIHSMLSGPQPLLAIWTLPMDDA